ASGVAVGDLDSDAIPDLVVADGGLEVMHGTGAGEFAGQQAQTLPPGTDALHGVVLGQLDRHVDGCLDAVVTGGIADGAAGDSGPTGVLLGKCDGSGSLRWAGDLELPGASYARLADLDGDGELDVV